MSKKQKSRKRKRGPTKPKCKIIQLPKGGQQIIETGPSNDKVRRIPNILGADFDFERNTIEYWQDLIDQAPKRDHKIRILMTCEASFLHTGFSRYCQQLLQRLHATGKYEVAELASYGGPADGDERAASVKWKYYHTMYSNIFEEEEFKRDEENQFGKWKLTFALADFKPDVVICIRDWWMDKHVLENPLRGKVHVMWMPTVDGYPQKWEWLMDYQNVDTLCTYSHFGKRVLESQSSWSIARARKVSRSFDVRAVCQPGVDLDVYKPLPANEAKKAFNIPDHFRFCGTVMRNQPRKLIPRIIESFGIFKREFTEQSHNVNLLLHTSIPDVGWDGGQGIMETIEREGLAMYVYLTYICNNCGHMMVNQFTTAILMPPEHAAQCPRCNQRAMKTPNTQCGYPPKEFNLVYNLMDVYIQGSVAEGDGMPVNEAKAAGVPCLVSDYSALAEKARNGGALPIDNDTIFNEGGGCPECDSRRRGGTMQWRSLFNRRDLAKKLARLYGDDNYRRRLGAEGRKCAEKYYNWELVAKKWEAIIDTAPLKDRSETWDSEHVIRVSTKDQAPDGLTNEEWLLWEYQNVLQRTEKDPKTGEQVPVSKVDNDGLRTWIGHMKQGAHRQELDKYFRSLMEDNDRVAKVLADPEGSALTPMEQMSKVIEESEK